MGGGQSKTGRALGLKGVGGGGGG
eukprot:COSAG01_NODE_28752_length_653_cov_3.032491_1_plen_23_part_10